MPICQHCQKEFVQPTHMKDGRRIGRVRKFCSVHCKSYYGFQKKAAEVGEQMCLQCQKPFSVKWSTDVKFCSMSCSTKWSHANRWTLKPRICITCDNSFESLRKDMKECPTCRKARFVSLHNKYKLQNDPT